MQEILSLDCEARYDYFLSKVGEDKEIWILVNENNEFLKIFAEDDSYEYLPVWPESSFAAEYSKDTNDLSPKSITLPEFFKKWVAGLKKDSVDIGVFPGLDKDLWVMEPSELKSDLQDELATF